MSYCRWSTDDFQCDLYCYEDCAGGFTIHVAMIRYGYKEPLPPAIALTDDNIEEWFIRHKVVQGMIEKADHIPIDLPHDGESFSDPDLQSFLERIVYLKSLGYRVPERVIEMIKEEQQVAP